MSDVLDRLDEALLEAARPQESHDEAWKIRDDDQAAWVSRKAQKAYQELARIRAWAEREKARIDAVAERESTPYAREVEWAEGHLHVWLNELLSEGRKKRSVELPGGRIQLRARPPKLVIEDDTEALEWLQVNAPEYVRVKESPNVGELRKALQTDGTLVALDGVQVSWARFEPQEDSVTFSPAEDE